MIVGCGFGGLFAARALRHAEVDVTVFDRNNLTFSSRCCTRWRQQFSQRVILRRQSETSCATSAMPRCFSPGVEKHNSPRA